MELDFTALNSIPQQLAGERPTERLEDTTGKFAIESEEPAAGMIDGAAGSGIQTLEKEKQERENIRKMYAAYQQNIRRAGDLRSNILKGIQRGEEPLALLLMALECISLMTGDKLIYTQGKEDIYKTYGWGKPL